MRTFKRNIPEIDTTLGNYNKYFNQFNFKGISEDDNIYQVDQESFRDVKNVYLDEDDHFVSRESLQTDINLLEDIKKLIDLNLYSLINIYSVGIGKLWVMKFKTDNTYSLFLITNDGQYHFELTGINKYHISVIEHYVIVFNDSEKGAQVFDTNQDLTAENAGWKDLQEFVEIPIVKRVIGNQITNYPKNQFTDYTKEQYVWSNNSRPSLPSGEAEIKVVSNNGEQEWKVADGDKNISVNTDYRLLVPLPIGYQKDDIITSAKNIICIARTNYFLISFNGGITFDRQYYPLYDGIFLKTASISQDGLYFMFVATDAVYQCNIVDIGQTSAYTWTKSYLNNDETNKIGQAFVDAGSADDIHFVNCLKYITNDIFSFMLNSDAIKVNNITQDYLAFDSNIYCKGPGLYSGTDYTKDNILIAIKVPDKFGTPTLNEVKNCLQIYTSTDKNSATITTVTFMAKYTSLFITEENWPTANEDNFGDAITVGSTNAICIRNCATNKYEWFRLVNSNDQYKQWITIIKGSHDTGLYGTMYVDDQILVAYDFLDGTGFIAITGTLKLNTIKSFKASDSGDGIYGISGYTVNLAELKTNWSLITSVKLECFIYDTSLNKWVLGNIKYGNFKSDSNTPSYQRVTEYEIIDQTVFDGFTESNEMFNLTGGYIAVPSSNTQAIQVYSTTSNEWAKLPLLKNEDTYRNINSINTFTVADYFYLLDEYNGNYTLYTNFFTDSDSATLTYTIIPTNHQPYKQIPQVSYADTQLYLGFNNLLQITNNITKDDKLLLNLPPINNQSFLNNITGLRNISTTEVAVFFEDRIVICSKQTDENYGYRYDYYNTKLSTGIRLGDDAINTLEGSYTIFPTQRGLALMNYQAFMATTDQTLQFITDTIKYIWQDFYNSSSVIKIIQWRNYLVFTNGTGNILLYDVNKGYWWRWQVPVNTLIALTDQIKLRLITLESKQTNGTLTVFTNKYTINGKTVDLNYYDFSSEGKNITIDWFVKSQPLHFKAPNYYKNIKQLVFQFFDETEALNRKTMLAQIKLYRKRVTIRDPETVAFKVEELRTFVKRFNYWKINELQWGLANDTNNADPRQLLLNGISIKYEIGEEVR